MPAKQTSKPHGSPQLNQRKNRVAKAYAAPAFTPALAADELAVAV